MAGLICPRCGCRQNLPRYRTPDGWPCGGSDDHMLPDELVAAAAAAERGPQVQGRAA